LSSIWSPYFVLLYFLTQLNQLTHLRFYLKGDHLSHFIEERASSWRSAKVSLNRVAMSIQRTEGDQPGT
ncbi:hypothetical protein, partial [Desulfobacula sp.]|uniref:hypothetical protein n=1 Tax=Desulfobacula sp. TaxID=2593537 RepID=UPI0025BEFBDB